LADECGGHNGRTPRQPPNSIPSNASSTFPPSPWSGKPPTNRPIDENTRCNPLEPYQQSKLEAETRVLAAHAQDGLPAIVLRPGAFYGPWGRYAFNRLFFEEPLKGWRIKVDNGRHITFPVFVPDVVQGVELALRNGRFGQIYNICGESLEHNRVNAIVNNLAGIGHWRLNFPTWMVLLLARSLDRPLQSHRPRAVLPHQHGPLRLSGLARHLPKSRRRAGFPAHPICGRCKANVRMVLAARVVETAVKCGDWRLED
jgi:nucleoside-diphosphate-sugar epimerase